LRVEQGPVKQIEVLLRLLVFVVLAWIVIAALRAYFIARKGTARNPNFAGSNGEEMVLDPQCQSYVPKSEALLRQGNYFCSEKCAALHLTR
jgi:Prokaryotic metallothionein